MSRRGRPKTTREIHGLIGEFIVPKLEAWLGGGKVWPVENQDACPSSCGCGVPEHWAGLDVCRLLDYGAHIDYLYEAPDGAVRGLAMRAQYWQVGWAKDWPWNTFTLRERDRGAFVEIDYLRKAAANREEGLLSPGYMVQAYIRDDVVDSVAIARIADLLRYVDCPPIGAPRAGSRRVKGGNQMRTVKWDDLLACGVWIKQWQRKDVFRDTA